MYVLRSAFLFVSLVSVASLANAQIFRELDGFGNNLATPDLGTPGTALLRRGPAAYDDGLNTPAGPLRPSARFVSNALCAELFGIELNPSNASDMFWQWGQFIDHDIDLSPGSSAAGQHDIDVPAGDPWFDPFATGNQFMSVTRTLSAPDQLGVRQQLNEITAFHDGSNVYGSDTVRALFLRENDGSGRLRVDAAGLLPRNTAGLPNAPSEFDTSMFIAGDVRVGEQTGLSSMHTLWAREHNVIAGYWRGTLPAASGELVYQLARAIVVAEMQHITYTEYLPILLGPNALPAYTGYDANIDPSISNEFSTVAYRFGHSMLSDELMRLNSNMNSITAGPLFLRDAFFNPIMLTQATFGGIEPILRGLSIQKARAVDGRIVDDVRNFLFGPPGSGGFDLAALNIQRAREHGIADYATLCGVYGMSVPATFADIPTSPVNQAALQSVYGSVNDIDPWMAVIMETPVAGGVVGSLAHAILVDQFTRLRDGDRYWYEGYIPQPYLGMIRSMSLSHVIRRNTSIGGELPSDVFHTL